MQVSKFSPKSSHYPKRLQCQEVKSPEVHKLRQMIVDEHLNKIKDRKVDKSIGRGKIMYRYAQPSAIVMHTSTLFELDTYKMKRGRCYGNILECLLTF